LGLAVWGAHSPRRTFGDDHWTEPIRWNKTSRLQLAQRGCARRVFCGSMCDWAEDHPTAAAIRPQLWDLIRRTPFLSWQLLTKRPERIAGCLPRDWGDGWPNVWLGVSVSEPAGLWRVAELRKIPAAVRFISYEPALADITSWLFLDGIHWVIFGGESGPGYRAPAGWQDWARTTRELCRINRVAFFFKQSPARRTETGITLDGAVIHQFP
jgi:protein gp37